MPASPTPPDLTRLLAEFDVGGLVASEQLPAGSRSARKVITTAGTFVLKPAYRVADAELQAEVAVLLNAHGIRQPSICRTRSGAVVANSGYFLQEFLPGSAPRHPTPPQVRAAMRHVAEYHRVLGELQLDYRPDPGSIWVRVVDSGFLITELPGLLSRYGIADEAPVVAMGYLESARPRLSALPRQVVHGDIGPDNVLMDRDAVVALIDFTPHVQPALFAASTALYWYHVYGQAEVSAARLRASTAAMSEARPWTDAELALWPASLVLEALRRLATPLALAGQNGGSPDDSVVPRLAAIRALVHVLPEISAATADSR